MPEFIYLKGKHNIVTDALCQLELDTPEFNTCYYAWHALSNRSLCCNDLPADAFPLQHELIVFHQTKNNLQPELLDQLKTALDGYHIKSFCGGGKKWDLICCKDMTFWQPCKDMSWNSIIVCYLTVKKPERSKLCINTYGGQI